MQILDNFAGVANQKAFDSAVQHLRTNQILLPRFSQLADPREIPTQLLESLSGVDRHLADPRNLFRLHWYNNMGTGGLVSVPDFYEVPFELTGTHARIIVVFGDRFPLIDAHKVLAAYACLVPRIVSGCFDPLKHSAVWPSTGNYCRGGMAISKILGCRGVAVLPEGMSRERFSWLKDWSSDPQQIIRTPGSESNVKEIYDACEELARDPNNVVINQFSEYGNYLAHFFCTGRAISTVFDHVRGDSQSPRLRLEAFVAGTGSAGTLAAGDYLKEAYGSSTVVVEPVECPTLVKNGYGSHNIQGIGDKHVPLIHNVMNTDAIVSISDKSSDQLYQLFNTAVGKAYLTQIRGIAGEKIDPLRSVGLSGIANILAAIKYARYFKLTAESVVVTVATDGASLYRSQLEEGEEGDTTRSHAMAENFGEHIKALGDASLMELKHEDRERVFNLGYYSWVEQLGIPLEDFERRRRQSFWRDLRSLIQVWDQQIDEFNRMTGLA